MQPNDEARNSEKIEELAALVRTRVPAPERELVEGFAREYYRQLDPEDLVARSTDELYGALMSHWQFARKRAPQTTRVRVISPSVAEHGWSSRHTMVEVVSDDMPFLVDSASAEVNRQGLTLHQIVHPIFCVERDADGVITKIVPRREGGNLPRESFMHLEVDRLVDPQQRAELAAGIERILSDVRAAVTDWPAMKARLQAAPQDFKTAPVPPAEHAEARAFIEWLAHEHLVLLGYRMQDLVKHQGEDALQAVAGSGLGILRESGVEDVSSSFAAVPPAARALARAASPLVIVTKGNARSTVHRSGYIDYVGIKRYDAAGVVIGEHRFLGLFTSTAYSERAIDVPLLRDKVKAVADHAGLAPGSHLAKAMQHILETYPRDDLFQISNDKLYEIALGILQLGERQRLRLFVRPDAFDRFMSCLIFVPRENYSTELRQKFVQILMAAFDGVSSNFDVLLTEERLARIHITVRTDPSKIAEYDRLKLESQLAAAARRWEDDLRDALIAQEGEAQGLALLKRYASAFPASYREQESPAAAVADIRKIEALAAHRGLGFALYQPQLAAAGTLGFKIYRADSAVVLSDSLPMLEHMGVRVLAERSHQIAPAGVGTVWLHDFLLEQRVPNEFEIDVEVAAPLFENAFARVFVGDVENDDFNRLVLAASLTADEVVVLRAYGKYLRQAGFNLSQSFIESTLAANAPIARLLVSLFRLRLDPAAPEKDASERQVEAIELALQKVSNLSEDRVLRQLLALVQATLRTNYWRRDAGGMPRSFLSFKFDPSKVPGLPDPRPLFEVFVYSARFEGIHLRGGKVARGGLRWSDRPEDFRTEVLGLMKAQMVKNTVIVPVGSKGGFVLKKAPPSGPTPADREAYLQDGIANYKDFLRGLLDLTDNLVNGQMVPPDAVRRHDADDPYLVVAADKGTATFSDFANGVSQEYGFWLGDAFASGGSVGYDHKKMGITARGAWESVKRHFREMGINTQTTDFTVVGIGDMSGDVFGNGMLLSPHIRLIAAFDHRHIFLDPNPDTAKSMAERQRLFELPRSSWADYNAELISEGGGVWPRSAKSIAISPQMRVLLGTELTSLPPTELISVILKAPVDLLYNGGIGTYVKASTESHLQVGDRANDALRVDGRQLRCKVVGEGGNLGFTQRARIEYAQTGGRIYTDAIDNSAGVDTSDHEVNIKILLSLPIADGKLTEAERNTQLAQMTDEVGAQVLRDNYFQTQALAIEGRVAPRLLEAQGRFIRFLEKLGRLNRAIEYLPDDEEIAARKARGAALTAPERAVLLAYSKMWLSDAVVASDLPEDAWVATALARYFPSALREQYGAYILRHPLKREIIATHVVNSMVNRVGPTFVHRQMESTGASAEQVVRAYLLTREVFGFVSLWPAIESLDNHVADALQAEMLIDLARLGERGTTWFLRSRRLAEPMAETIARFGAAAQTVLEYLGRAQQWAGRKGIEERRQALTDQGVPALVAERVASADAQFSALDIAEIADKSQRSIADVAQAYFALGDRLGLARLRAQVAALVTDGYWQGMAKAALSDDLSDLQRLLTANAVSLDAGQGSAVGAWEAQQSVALERARRMLDELADAKSADLAMLSVALRELRNLV